MTERPWESEPDSLDFEADGLPCAMRRHPRWRSWCGYVGVGPEHPLFGLPTNHLLKLPASWFERRRGLEGTSVFDIFLHALRGQSIEDGCPIGMALQVHGGVNFAEDSVPGREQDGRWWFGFDCAHAGDYLPGLPNVTKHLIEMADSAPVPEAARKIMRDIVTRRIPKPDGDYRDQQYVVAECQHLAAQLISIVAVIEAENVNAGPDHRRS